MTKIKHAHNKNWCYGYGERETLLVEGKNGPVNMETTVEAP